MPDPAVETEVPRYRWVVIGTMASSISISMAMLFFIGLLLPDIAEDLDLSPSAQGWLGSSALIANLTLVMPINTWGSRLRPYRTIMLALIGVAASVFLQAWAPVFAVLIVGRISLSIGIMFTQASRVLIIQQWSTRRQLAVANSVLIGSVDLMMGIVSFLTPLIIAWTGDWRRAMTVWGVVCLCLASAWTVLGRERVTEEHRQRVSSQQGTPLRSLLRYRELWYVSIGLCGVAVGEVAFAVFWPTLAEDKLHLSGTVIGVAVGLSAITAAPATMGINAVPLFFRHKAPVLAVCGLGKFVLILALLYIEAPGIVMVLAAAKGVFSAFFAVVMGMVFYLPNIKPREVAVGQAFLRISLFSGAAVGPLMVGFIQESTADLQTAMLVTAFFPLALVISSVLFRRPSRVAIGEAPAS